MRKKFHRKVGHFAMKQRSSFDGDQAGQHAQEHRKIPTHLNQAQESYLLVPLFEAEHTTQCRASHSFQAITTEDPSSCTAGFYFPLEFRGNRRVCAMA